MKKAMIILLFATLAGTFIGCKESAHNGNKPKEVVNVEFLVSSPAASDEQFILKDLLQEKFGISVKFSMAAQGAHLEKLQLLVAANSLPDLMSPVPSETAHKIGSLGALVPYNEHLDKMPNYKKMMESDPVSYASMYAADGNIYIAPQYSEFSNVHKVFRYIPTMRTDLMESVGLEVPETFDELYKGLKAIKSKHPETVGLVNRTGTDIFKDLGYSFGTRPDITYNYEQEKYVFGPESENYKAMISYLNKLWKEGLADPELFTASTQQYEAKVINGLGVFLIDWEENSNNYWRTHDSLNSDSAFRLEPIMPIISDVYKRKIVQQMPETNLYTSMVLSKKSPAVDKLIQFVDWLYSDEGSIIVQFGAENVTYAKQDGRYKFLPNIIADYNPDGSTDIQKDYGIKLPHIIRLSKDLEYEERDEYTQNSEAILKQYIENQYNYPVNNGIELSFTEEETATIGRLRSDINTCVNEWSIEFVTGSKSLDKYDEFLQETKARGVDELVDIYNDAYTRFTERINNMKK
ncbi:MAG: extracellular solute-binding protein [Firmicutes bacterium]|nr:extracellular solute-binding protein [Bacillota bacterium]